ncbi:MAG: hypothetical protein ABR985_22355 [Methanotrichaceae archaeon]
MGLEISSYVDWVRAERRLVRALGALIKWGWVACDERQKEEGHKFWYKHLLEDGAGKIKYRKGSWHWPLIPQERTLAATVQLPHSQTPKLSARISLAA